MVRFRAGPDQNPPAKSACAAALLLMAGLLVLCPLLSGCSRFQLARNKSKRVKKYETISADKTSTASKAKELNSLAMEAMRAQSWPEAEKTLSEALAVDVNYGPAHNNLGQIYLKRHNLYLAAWEFEFALNLMPERVEPHFNLGLVYETAMQHERAREHYQAAVDLDPSHTESIANLARVCVKLDDDPAYINGLLNQVVMGDTRPTWVRWAKDLLATRYQSGLRGDTATGTQGDEDWKMPLNSDGLPSGLAPLNGLEEVPLHLPAPSNVPTIPGAMPGAPSSTVPPPSAAPVQLQDTERSIESSLPELPPLPDPTTGSIGEALPMNVTQGFLRDLPQVPKSFTLETPVSYASGTKPIGKK